MATKFERSALYDEVWTVPLSQLCKKYGLSDNGLRKICKAMNIPLPRAGHWAKVAAGHSIEKVPLPPQAERATFVSDPRPREPSYRLPEDDVWLAEMCARDAAPAAFPSFEVMPGRWHPVVRDYRRKLSDEAKKVRASRLAAERYEKLPASIKSRTPNHDGWKWLSIVQRGQILSATHKPAAVRVSLGTYERAVTLLNALALAAVQRGFKVKNDDGEGRMVIDGHGGTIQVRIVERLEEKIKKELSYDGKWRPEKYKVPTGILRLCLELDRFTGTCFEDGSAEAIDKQLPKLLSALYRLVIRCRLARRASEERARLRVEESKQREASALLRREEERLKAVEQERRESLLAEVERWSQARRLRTYIEHVRKAPPNNKVIGVHDPMQTWLAWAESVADNLDPTSQIASDPRG